MSWLSAIQSHCSTRVQCFHYLFSTKQLSYLEALYTCTEMWTGHRRYQQIEEESQLNCCFSWDFSIYFYSDILFSISMMGSYLQNLWDRQKLRYCAHDKKSLHPTKISASEQNKRTKSCNCFIQQGMISIKVYLLSIPPSLLYHALVFWKQMANRLVNTNTHISHQLSLPPIHLTSFICIAHACTCHVCAAMVIISCAWIQSVCPYMDLFPWASLLPLMF